METRTTKILCSLATAFCQGPVITADTFKYVNQDGFKKWLKRNTHRFNPCILDTVNEFINQKNK
jgi:hypothetical protein